MGFWLFKKGSLRRTFFVNLIAGIRFMGPLAALLVVLKLISGWMTNLLMRLPDVLNPYTYLPNVPGIGLVTLIIALVALGWITRRFTDTWLMRLLDKMILAIPVLNSLYKAFKQLTEMMLRNHDQEYSQVVLVPFPQTGMYSMGLVTGPALPYQQPEQEKNYMNIFLPTTPNLTSGFYIQAPKDSLVPLAISVEDALRVVVSAGLARPENHLKDLIVPDLVQQTKKTSKEDHNDTR